jgi:hypothetical protein
MTANLAVDMAHATSAKDALVALHKFIVPGLYEEDSRLNET